MKLLINGGAIETIIRLRSERPDLHQYVGWLNTPKTMNKTETLIKQGCKAISLDNAAYVNFCERRYLRMLDKWRDIDFIKVNWVTVPDVVGDASTTLSLFYDWQDRIPECLPLAFVGQDGCEDIDLPWNMIDCFFIGGTTEWKLSSSAINIATEAKKRGKLVHVGRVNSQKRLRFAWSIKADSVDGTGYSKYNRKELVKALEYVKYLHMQMSLF